MKNFLSVFLAIVMLFCIVPTSAFAAEDYGNVIASGTCGAEPNPDSVTWTRYDSGTLVFSGNGAMRDYFEFTQNYCEYPIIDYTYQEIDTKHIIIEEGITYIGEQAFFIFSALENIEIPGSIIEIGQSAFALCRNLKSVKLNPGTKKIDSGAFSGCTQLKNIELSSTIEVIEDNAFSQCTNLKNIEIPESVKTIGERAFFQTSIKEFFIPANVSSIGIIPVLSPYLKKFSIDSNNNNYYVDNFGILFSKDEKALLSYPTAADITEYTIPDGVSTIKSYAFFSNCNLETIIMPDSLITIEPESFAYSISLKNIIFSENLETIGDIAFALCASLENITIPASIKTIGEGAFTECIMISSFTIEGMGTELGNESIGYVYAQPANGFSKKEVAEKCKAAFMESILGDPEKAQILTEEYDNSCVEVGHDNATKDTCTIYCHSGSTAETYAIENKVSYETVHF
ncbi:MAG: leucine-rich repeat domain-containing protein, partial [Faecalibacterium sp.]|nr:leucine-rich repeat domain-containing protein [Ruminococcus sp.]MCM1393133.1 leucine-rich repeat domain-containing protein [Ruminococcus sp.]MCM1486473.1 leucine-rich repeat domain-containing protein [Faecalibacterium sp.]